MSDERRAETVTLDDDERTRCEVWTRVMGYHRPVGAFNAGKQAEHRERVAFAEPGRAAGRQEG
jgi:hypothetical protein